MEQAKPQPMREPTPRELLAHFKLTMPPDLIKVMAQFSLMPVSDRLELLFIQNTIMAQSLQRLAAGCDGLVFELHLLKQSLEPQAPPAVQTPDGIAAAEMKAEGGTT